jgi:hypothetical protein
MTDRKDYHKMKGSSVGRARINYLEIDNNSNY